MFTTSILVGGVIGAGVVLAVQWFMRNRAKPCFKCAHVTRNRCDECQEAVCKACWAQGWPCHDEFANMREDEAKEYGER